MNFTKFCTVFLMGSLFFSFVSCSDDDNGNDNGLKGNIYLPSVVVDKSSNNGSVATTYYSYDTENRLTLVVMVEDEDGTEVADSIKIAYDAQGRISSVMTESDTVKYTYSGNKVFGLEEYTGGSYKDTLELGSNNELLKLYSKDRIYTYEYDAKGNLAKYIKKYDNSGQVYTYTVKYDDKNGIFKHIKTPRWYFIKQSYGNFFVNNALEEIEDSEVMATFILKYNDAGYPISVEKKEGSRESIATIEYIKK